MGIKTVRHPPNSPDVAPCDFWLFPKFRGCRYEAVEEVKEAVTKVIDTLTQEDFHGAFQKLLERYNQCIASGGDYFEGDLSFMCVLSIKVHIRNKSGNLFNDPGIYPTSPPQERSSSYIHFRINILWKDMNSLMSDAVRKGMNPSLPLPVRQTVL